MPNKICNMKVRNFRCLSDVSVDLHNPMILFGPNGSGKSSFLDTIWFVRDCAIRGVEMASSSRNHGVGMLFADAPENSPISIAIENEAVCYELTLIMSSGRIDSYAGERVIQNKNGLCMIDRSPGNTRALFRKDETSAFENVELRDPEKLSLGRFQDYHSGGVSIVDDLDEVLHNVRLYYCRAYNLYRIRKVGSESDYSERLWDRGENIWSVLRNILGKRRIDARYDTIIHFMRKAFPEFDDLVFNQTGPSSVYGSFLFRDFKEPVYASGVSDGHLHMLLLLTALFCESDQKELTIIFDEPDLSLHPWAIAVFAEAVKKGVERWNRHVILATHSPVLMSQFETGNIVATGLEHGRAVLTNVSTMNDIGNLLDQYAVGSLYMAQLIAPQGIEDQLSPGTLDESQPFGERT